MLALLSQTIFHLQLFLIKNTLVIIYISIDIIVKYNFYF